MDVKQRILWGDVAKCFGIFAIYLGHYRYSAGNAFGFVFAYHVPLFFLLSGCMESRNSDTSLKTCLRKTLRGIFLPWFVFCLLSVVVYALENDSALLDMWPMIWKIGKGTLRNTYFAVGLWFLTCLGCTKILFCLIKKLRIKAVIFAVCAGLYLVSLKFVDIENPRWLFNADCALYYVFYYGLGYLLFPYIDRLLNPQSRGQKLLLAASACLSVAYCAYLFFGRNLYGFLEGSRLGGIVYPIATALTCIWFHFCGAKALEQVPVFQEIGRNTLYLCGSEYLIKTLVTRGCSVLGLTISLPTPLAAFLLTAALLWLANRYLVPVEKKLIASVAGLFPAAAKITVH